jgi:hypothetical protein
MNRLLVVLSAAVVAVGLAVIVAVVLPTGPSDREETSAFWKGCPSFRVRSWST